MKSFEQRFIPRDNPQYAKEAREAQERTREENDDALFFASNALRAYKKALSDVDRFSQDAVRDVARQNEHRQAVMVMEEAEREMKSEFDILFSPIVSRSFVNARDFFIFRALQNPHVKAILEEEVGVLRDDVVDFKRFYLQGKISPRAVAAMIEYRREYMVDIRDAWEAKTTLWKNEFKESVAHAIENKFFPSGLVYEKFVDHMDVAIGDVLSRPFTGGLNNIEGDGRSVIFAGALEDEKYSLENIRHKFFHELLHQISGVLVKEYTQPHKPEQKQYAALKQGLSFPKKGTWLNEGLTELLAVILSGYSHEETYVEFKNIVRKCLKDGIPRDLFIHAYFESSLEDAAPGEHMKHYRALNAAMTKKYGAGWLVKLAK